MCEETGNQDQVSGIAGIRNRLNEQNESAGIDAYKYCGVISLNKDPLDIQSMLRDEWK